MKKLNISWLLSFVAALTMGLASCTSDPVEDNYILLGKTEATVNKKGVSDKGQKLSFTVESNVYWTIDVPEEDNWLQVSPSAGSGHTEVWVEVFPNSGEERTATLELKTMDGLTQHIVITQSGSETVLNYLSEVFDGLKVEADTRFDLFASWKREGVSSQKIEYEAVGALVSSDNASTGYDNASGVNNIYLPEAESNFVVSNFDTKGDESFILTFGYAAPVAGRAATVAEDLKLYVAKEKDVWCPVGYTLVGDANAWRQAKVEFKVPIDAPILAFKFQSVSGGSRIDDVSFMEGNGGGEFLSFVPPVQEEVLWSDDFGWINYGTDFIKDPANTAETAYKSWTEEEKAKGWTTQTSYLYGKPGYVKFGKTTTGGDIVSPALGDKTGLSLKYASVTVRFKVSAYKSNGGTMDLNKLGVEIIGGGTASQTEFIVTNYNKFQEYSFTITDFDPTTQIKFCSGVPNADQVAQAKSNRFFFDDFSIATTSVGEPFNQVVSGLPVQWTLPAAFETDGEAMSKTEKWCKSDDKSALIKVYRALEGPAGKTDMSYTVTALDAGRLLVYSMRKDDYWKFTIPVKNVAATTKIKVESCMRSSATGPKFFAIEYSTDDVNWTGVNIKNANASDYIAGQDRAISYTIDLPSATKYDISESFVVGQKIVDGNLHIRFRVSDVMRADKSTSSDLATASNAGTNRITRQTDTDTPPILKISQVVD